MQINKKFFNKYEKWLSIVENMKVDIKKSLYPYILYDINKKWGNWVKNTSNRPYVINFQIGYSNIDVTYGIYAGCGETEEFNISVPIEFLLSSKEEQEKIIEDKETADKKLKEEKNRQEKLTELLELEEKITKIKKNLGE